MPNLIRIFLPFFALIAAVLSMIPLYQVFTILQNALISPLSNVYYHESAKKNVSINYLPGFLTLFATYFIFAWLSIFFGCPIGMHPIAMHIEVDCYKRTIDCLIIGIAVVILVRFYSVLVSTSLAIHFHYLLCAAFALLVYLVIAKMDTISLFIDGPFRHTWAPAFQNSEVPYLAKNVRIASAATYINLYILSGALLGAFLSEGIIILLSKLNLFQIPLSLLRERSEQNPELDQIFHPSKVTKSINDAIAKEVSKNGLSEFLWLTNSLRNEHIVGLQKSLNDWLLNEKNITDDAERIEKAGQIIKASVRIIIHDRLEYSDLISPPYSLPKQVLKIINRPPRSRFLIINGKIAIIHMPLPFREMSNQLSNFAVFTDKEEYIYSYRSQFGILWDDMLHIGKAQEVVDMFIGTKQANNMDKKILNVLSVIYYSRLPITIDDISSRSINNIALVNDIVESLLAQQLIQKVEVETGVGKQIYYSPGMYPKICRTANVIENLAS